MTKKANIKQSTARKSWSMVPQDNLCTDVSLEADNRNRQKSSQEFERCFLVQLYSNLKMEEGDLA